MKKHLTIVGPEASGLGQEMDSTTRVHIESLLLMAKYDKSLHEDLMTNRREALDQLDIVFTPAEKILLNHISNEKLAQAIAEFNIPGISKSSLPDWRKVASVLLLVTGTLLSMPNCSSMFVNTTSSVADKQKITDGWVDENTFRASAIGWPRRSEKNIIKRKRQARDVAIILAQKTILEKFKGIPLQGAGASGDSELTGIAVAKKFGVIVKSGKVIHEKYDKDQNCEVVYEVTAPKLKKEVMFGI